MDTVKGQQKFRNAPLTGPGYTGAAGVKVGDTKPPAMGMPKTMATPQGAKLGDKPMKAGSVVSSKAGSMHMGR